MTSPVENLGERMRTEETMEMGEVGDGVPVHVMPESCQYWDYTNNLFYISLGGGAWQLISRAGPVGKHFLAPFIHGWDLSTVAPVVVTDDYLMGLPLIDANRRRLTARWAVPDDYISDMTATPVIVEDVVGVGGNIRMDFAVFYGICTQLYNTYNDQSGYFLTAVTSTPGNILRCLTSNTVTLTNATTDSLVTCYLERDGGHAGDTAAMTVFGFGVLVEYTG